VLRRMVCICAVSTAVSTCSCFPHTLSYFTEIAGGPFSCPYHILDAGFDWGQDLLFLKDWHASHPRPGLYVGYFGAVSPDTAEIDCLDMSSQSVDATHPVSGTVAVSANALFGYRHYADYNPDHSWLLQLEPTAFAGYSIWIYELGGHR